MYSLILLILTTQWLLLLVLLFLMLQILLQLLVLRLLKMKKSRWFNSKHLQYNPLLEKEDSQLRGTGEIIRHKRVMIIGTTDTNLEMSIADIMIIDPCKSRLMRTGLISVVLIEMRGITMIKGQVFSKQGMMMSHIMKNLSLPMLIIQVTIIQLTLRQEIMSMSLVFLGELQKKTYAEYLISLDPSLTSK